MLKRPYGYSGLSCTKSSASLSVIGKAYAAGVVENTGILPTAHVFLLGHVIHHCWKGDTCGKDWDWLFASITQEGEAL